MLQKDLHQAPQAVPSNPPEASLLTNNLDQPPGPDAEELAGLFPSSFRGLTPAKLPSSDSRPRLPSLVKFQQLKETVTKRLSSLDAGWLDRCQGAELHPKEGLKGDSCPGEISGAAQGQGSPEHKPLETLPLSRSGEREQGTFCISPGGQYPEDLLRRKPICLSAGDKCMQESLIPSKEGTSAAPTGSNNAVSSTVNLDATQQVEIQLLGGKVENALSEAEDRHRPNKREKASRLQDTVTHKGGSMDHSKGGNSGVKRKRATELAREGPAKKRCGVTQKQQLSEYDFDCQEDAAGVQEEKETAAPTYSENLLGEVEEEHPKQRGQSSIPTHRYVLGGETLEL